MSFRELPGVKELLESARQQKAPPKEAAEKTQWELTRGIDAEYYGFGYETPEMLAVEADTEQALTEELLANFSQGRQAFEVF